VLFGGPFFKIEIIKYDILLLKKNLLMANGDMWYNLAKNCTIVFWPSIKVVSFFFSFQLALPW